MLFGSGRYLFSGSTEYMLCRRCWLEGGPVAAGARVSFRFNRARRYQTLVTCLD